MNLNILFILIFSTTSCSLINDYDKGRSLASQDFSLLELRLGSRFILKTEINIPSNNQYFTLQANRLISDPDGREREGSFCFLMRPKSENGAIKLKKGDFFIVESVESHGEGHILINFTDRVKLRGLNCFQEYSPRHNSKTLSFQDLSEISSEIFDLSVLSGN